MNRWPLLLILYLCGCGTPIPPKRSTNTVVLTASAPVRAIIDTRLPVGAEPDTRARITAIQATLPSEGTPPYCLWGLFTNQWGAVQWVSSGCRTAQFCKDITITHTTMPGKLYALEFSHFLDGWQKVSASATELWYQGTNGTATVRIGSPYAWNFFRIQEQ